MATIAIIDQTLFWIKHFWFLWLPLLLGYLCWHSWVRQLRTRFIKNLTWTLLEIKLPRDISKSPRAMEVILNALHQTSDGNFIKKYWKGFLRMWFSLEIVGINGHIHFFVYTQTSFRNLVEAQFYAQYPGIEIVEVEDYTKNANFNNFDQWNISGVEFGLTNEDAYPIRTYIDYGLHELATKEEQKTDPMTAFLEFLGSLKQGEQVWLQILIMATKKKWKDEGKKIIEKIMKRDQKPKEGEKPAPFALSPGERSVVEAIEKDISKLGFDVGIRGIYLARKDMFNPVNVASLVGLMKQYNALNLNGFKPIKSRGTSVDYLFKKRREKRRKIIALNIYTKRAYFYMPYTRFSLRNWESFVLNTEELATIYHFPGRVAETPTFAKIEAKKSKPPINLPI